MIDCIVLPGGCALNVKANQVTRDTLGIQVFVPAASNNSGGTKQKLPSLKQSARQVLVFIGPCLWDHDQLHIHANHMSDGILRRVDKWDNKT